MNDRFRFRAIDNREWSDEKGKIYYDVQDAYDWSGGEPDVPATSFGCIVDGEGWIVEQCTGLKDKNCRMIYEGDIVESTIATRNNKPARDIVKYNNEFAGFEPMCLYDCDCGIYNPSDELLIVGNIHENPELLEDK